MCARDYGFQVINVFVLCCVDEDEIKFFWFGWDCFGGVAEDLSDVRGEAGFCDVFFC